MIEDLLTQMDKPYRAIKLLLIYLDNFINEDIINDIDMSIAEKNQNLTAISHAIYLVNEDLAKLKQEYYELMLKEKYR